MATSVREELRSHLRGERGPAFTPGVRRVAMAYPSPYRAGMSSLGFQWITTRLREAGLAAERVFLPDDPALWRRTGTPPVSCETETPLGRFPLVAVSLAYELELLGLLELLDLAGIPLLREDRGAWDPLVLLGGPITMANPLCAAPFVDAMLLGEADHTAALAASAAFDCADREGWLDAVAALPGGYVPERHGTAVPPPAGAPDHLLPAHSSWLCADAELSEMFLVEGERGCHRRCTFCVMRRSEVLGGMRKLSPEHIVSLVPDDARKVGLVGAAISDHPGLIDIIEPLVASGRRVSLSSLRADRIHKRPRISELLRQSGARTLTVASDAASARLRRTISKGTSEEHLLGCADQIGRLGYDTLKVYMMLGLPDETDADIDELVRFTLELAERARPGRVALGVAPFVAKRHTPLDGVPFAGISVVERRLKRLQRGLAGRATVRPASARWAWVEHALAQGGPEVGLATLEAWRNGGKIANFRTALAKVPADSARPWARLAPAAAQ